MYAVADPDLQLSEEGWKVWGGHPEPEIGGWSQKQFFSALWTSVWSKNKGGPGPPGSATVYVSKTLEFHLSIAVPLCIIHTSQYVLAMRDRATSTK